MKKISTLVAALALAALANASANAATVSYSFVNELATTDIHQTGALGLFDAALGTLTGATINVNGAAVFNFSGYNRAAQTQSAKITSSVDLSFTTTLVALQTYLDDALSLSHASGSQSYAVGQTRSFGAFNESATNTDDLSDILGSLQALGGGTFGLSCQSESGLAITGGGGNINTTQSTQAACGAAITYTYTAAPLPQVDVPEPGSLALVGLAVFGAGVTTSRRRSSSSKGSKG